MADPLIGTTLSHYHVLERLGAGGMGVVYRARDQRLHRDIALKLLLADTVSGAGARARLVREGQTASALNHPHICTIHEVGEVDGHVFIAMEYVAGQRLSDSIPPRGLPEETLRLYGSQIADALEHAHRNGIIHRDLKASNVIITLEGRAKVLDFGLAKHVKSAGFGDETQTGVSVTQAGTVVGTLDHMSPEVLRGEAADARSDIWALGVVLYVMATGEHPFRGNTAFELTGAILNQPPVAIPTRILGGLRGLILKCLAKDPHHRYERAGEVRAALEIPGGLATARVPPVSAGLRRLWIPLAATVAIVAAVALGSTLANKWRKPPPTYQQLTFRRGAIGLARFTPDANSVIYSAAWADKPFELFSAKPGFPESRSLGLSNAWLLAVSSAGEMAFLQNPTLWSGPFSVGTLAQVPLSGGEPRLLRNDIDFADWAPDGKSFAVVRDVDGKFRIEFPAEKLLYETAGWITHPRISPRGDRTAFIEHPQCGDFQGSIAVVDLAGRKKILSDGWNKVWGLAWSPNGKDVWFTAKREGAVLALYAVSLSGKLRIVRSESSSLTLEDISRDGRVLVTRDTDRSEILGRFAGETKVRDLSVLDNSLGMDLSADGKTLLVSVKGGGGGSATGSVYLRRTDGSPAVRLGEGEALALSPDGKWALAKLPGPEPAQLQLLPTGAGDPRPLPRNQINHQGAIWMPDGEHILFVGNEPGQSLRTYLQDIHGGAPRPVTPLGVCGTAISPDGKWILAPQSSELYPIDGGKPKLIPGVEEGDFPLRFSGDGRSLYLQNGDVKASMYRLHLATGEQEFLRDLAPPDPAGIVGISHTLLTPDGGTYVSTYQRTLSDLYLVKGLF
jgi:Tol biopolymer transport system component/tRNA A-37 threonylcarbamoyl transferase component Bud32